MLQNCHGSLTMAFQPGGCTMSKGCLSEGWGAVVGSPWIPAARIRTLQSQSSLSLCSTAEMYREIELESLAAITTCPQVVGASKTREQDPVVVQSCRLSVSQPSRLSTPPYLPPCGGHMRKQSTGILEDSGSSVHVHIWQELKHFWTIFHFKRNYFGTLQLLLECFKGHTGLYSWLFEFQLLPWSPPLVM